MVNEIIYFGTVFLSVMFMVIGIIVKIEDHARLIFLGLATFIGIGGSYLSYQEGVPYYAYVPLAVGIVSIVYIIYIIYTIISNEKDWGDEVDEGNKLSDFS